MFRQIYKIIILGIFFVATGVLAGTFTPAPAEPGAGLYTLSDIYNTITDSNYSHATHDFSPASSTDFGGTFVTLAQIWNAIPPFRTLSEGGLDSGVLEGGIYATTTDLTAVEPNLLAANIATGTTMFGITGTCKPKPAGTFSLSFDGTDSSVEIPNSDALNLVDTDFTITGWIYPRRTSADGAWGHGPGDRYGGDGLVDHATGGSGDPGWGVWWNQNAIRFWFGDGTDINSADTLPLNQWGSFAVVYDHLSKDLSFYINGSFSNTWHNIGPITARNASLYLGQMRNMAYFDGKLDQILIFNRMLTPSEIGDLHNGGDGLTSNINYPPFNNGLVAGWAIKEGIGSVINNLVPTGDSGQINGADWESGKVD